MKIIDIPFWTWIPTVSIGPFRFGMPISEYIKRYNLRDEDEFNASEYPELKLKTLQEIFGGFRNINQYTIPTYGLNFSIYTENGIIDEFKVETYLYYNGQDIIMSPLEKAMEIIGRNVYDGTDREEISDEMQEIYYFDDLGLSLWTLDNVVVTAFCSHCIFTERKDVNT